jgi:flagellar biosynthesis GTPase FlhF
VLDQEPGGYSCGSPELGPRIHKAMEIVCDSHGIPAANLAVSIRIVVFAPSSYIGPKKVWGRFSTDLDGVLRQRESLLQAKAAGWTKFRAAWIELMQTPITPRDTAWGHALSRPRTEAEAAAVVDAAWESHREARERRAEQLRRQEECRVAREKQRVLRHERRHQKQQNKLQYRLKKLARASSAVERILDAEAQQATLEAQAAVARAQQQAKHEACQRKQQEALRRKQRWKWLRDPARTVGELLHGPPG